MKLFKGPRRKLAIALTSAAAVVATGGAALAAVLIFGFGQASVAATATQNLTVDNIDVTAPLLPGGTVGAKGIVHNPNNYPVKVSAVIIRADGATGVPAASCGFPAVLTPKGVFNANYGPGIGAGWKTAIAAGDQVTVPANGAAWVSIPEAVSQAAGSTSMCGFTASIAVEALAGN